MAAQVGHRAVAKVPPAIPFGPGNVDIVEGSLGRGPSHRSQSSSFGTAWTSFGRVLHKDDVVVLLGSSSLCSPRRARPTRAPRCTAPIAPRPNQFDDAAIVVAGVDLNAHLRGHFGLRGSLANQRGPPTRCASAASRNRRACPPCSAGSVANACVCSQVLTTTASNSRAWSYTRRKSENFLGLRMLCRCLVDRILRNVAQRHDILARNSRQVRCSAPTNTNASDVQLVVQVSPAQERRSTAQHSACSKAGLQELTAGW